MPHFASFMLFPILFHFTLATSNLALKNKKDKVGKFSHFLISFDFQ